MIIKVENRLSITRFKTDIPHIIISITEDKDFPEVYSNDSCKGILRLTFHDLESELEPEFMDKYKVVLFNEDLARKILNFVFENLNNIKAIICQCDAGISRSAGTAKALDKILNNNATTEYQFNLISSKFDSYPYMPNQLVFRTIIREYVKIKLGE